MRFAQPLPVCPDAHASALPVHACSSWLRTMRARKTHSLKNFEGTPLQRAAWRLTRAALSARELHNQHVGKGLNMLHFVHQRLTIPLVKRANFA